MPRKRVEKPTDIPAGDHFVIMEYKQEQQYEPPYDKGGQAEYHPYLATYHYVYMDRGEWVAEIERMYHADPKRTDFAFFEAAGRGVLQVQVSVAAPHRR